MLARPLKTALLLIGLFSRTTLSQSQALNEEKSLAQSTNDICLPLHPLNIFYHSIPQPENITPVVSTTLMASRITGKEKYQLAILDAITKIKMLNPEIETLINFVFTHSPDFKIAAYPYKEFKKISQTEAGLYDGIHKTIILSSKFIQGDINKLMLILSIYFRHAAINTMHLVLSKDNSAPFVTPWYPYNDKEKQKISDLVNEEDKNVLLLNEYLEKEERHTLDSKTLKKLNELRSQVNSSFHAFYKKSRDTISKINQETLSHLESVLKTKLRPGILIPGTSISEVAFADDMNYGQVKVVSIKKVNGQKGIINLQLELQDPLRFFIKCILDERKVSNSIIKPGQGIAVFDASLYGSVHPVIIKYLYPKFTQKINQLIQSAQQIAVPFKPSLAEHKTVSQRQEEIKLHHSLKPELYNPDHYKKMIIDAVNKAANNPGDTKESIEVLEKIIASKHDVGEASLALATIYATKNEFFNANKYFKIAKELNIEFSPTVESFYQTSLKAVQAQKMFSPASNKKSGKQEALEKTLFKINLNNPIR